MSRLVYASAIALGAAVVDSPPRVPAPRVHGLSCVQLGEIEYVRLPPTAPDDGCAAGTLDVYVVHADVMGVEGHETLSASYTDGMTVRDSEGRLLARTTGFPCEGSADELAALAVGRVDGSPVVVLVATSGGRHEASTAVVLYRPEDAQDLVPAFSAVVETWDGETRATGSIWMEGDGLIYRPPTGGEYGYTFDPVGRTYEPTGRIDRVIDPLVPTGV